MEELIKNKLYDVLIQSCDEPSNVIVWRGKINSTDVDEWKIMAECIKKDEEYLIKIKKRIVR